MKSAKEFLRKNDDDNLRKAAKLDPIRRSGKERHQLYKSLSTVDNDDDKDDQNDYIAPKRESALDYLDDDL